MTILALLLGCGASGYGCDTLEHSVAPDDAEAGIDANALAAALPARETLAVVAAEPVYDLDEALAAVGPYTVEVDDVSVDEAVVRTQVGAGDFCLFPTQLRVPVRLHLASADGSLDVRVSQWLVSGPATVTTAGTSQSTPAPPPVAQLEGDGDPAAQAVNGVFPAVMVDAFEADLAGQHLDCDVEDVDAVIRVFYDGPVDAERELFFDATFQETGCINSAHALGLVRLAPEAG